jgi:aminodeoxyfutalosine synthase
MLFGHIEKPEDRIAHMRMLRDLQDEAPGFFAFIPLVYHPEHNALHKIVPNITSEEDILRTVAVARLFLDNFPHIKAYWIQMGIETAMKALHAGASDLDGTIIEEKITHAAGATVPVGMSPERMKALISNEGLIPVERDALYERFS